MFFFPAQIYFSFPFFHFIFVDLHQPHLYSLATTIVVLRFNINIYDNIFFYRLSHKVTELTQVGSFSCDI